MEATNTRKRREDGSAHDPQDSYLDPIASIETEAKSIKSALSAAGRDQTRLLLDRLKALSARLPADGRKARRSAAVIQTAIIQAEQQLEALSDEELRDRNDPHLRGLFEVAVYASMSRTAQAFYNNIQSGQTYRLAPVADNGVVAGSARKSVDGQELRHKFSLLKYHSMSEEEKRKVLEQSFGTGAGASERISGNPDMLRAERGEMAYLHHALRDMEAYKAYTSLSRRKGGLMATMLDISYRHDHFMRAHAQIDAVLAAYDRLIESPGDEAANIALQRLREQMKKTLKEDIIDGVLLRAEGESPERMQEPSIGQLMPKGTPLAREDGMTELVKPPL